MELDTSSLSLPFSVLHTPLLLSDSRLHLFLQSDLSVMKIERCALGKSRYTVAEAIQRTGTSCVSLLEEKRLSGFDCERWSIEQRWAAPSSFPTWLLLFFPYPPSLVCLRVWEEASTGPRREAPTHSWSPRTENRSCAVVFRALSAPWQTTAEPPQPFPQATSKMKSSFYLSIGYINAPLLELF